MGHRVKAVEAEMKDLAGHIAKDVDLGQSTLDQMQESLSKFGDNFVTLSDTLKDLFSSQRTSGNREEELRLKVVAEVGSAKEILQHIRTNTNSHNKTLQNLMWEIQELRTGGKEQESGKVSGQRVTSGPAGCSHRKSGHKHQREPDPDGTQCPGSC